jgi:hypothetical protein
VGCFSKCCQQVNAAKMGNLLGYEWLLVVPKNLGKEGEWRIKGFFAFHKVRLL